MKKIFLLLCLLASIVCYAENTVVKEGTSTLTKDEMWSNVTKLVLSSTDEKYADYRIISSDKTLGQIILELIKDANTGPHWEAIIKMRICIEMKDERYRISDMGSKIRFKMGSEYDYVSSHSTAYLNDMMIDLKVMQALFNEEEVQYSSFMDNKEYYSRLLSSTPRYLKPKDERKNKINPEYEKYYRIINACDAVKKTVDDIQELDGFFLSKALIEKNSF